MRNWADVVPPEVAAEQEEWEVVQSARRMMGLIEADEIERRLGKWTWVVGIWSRHLNKPSPVERYLAQNLEVRIIARWLELKHEEQRAD